ncbi:MAG: helix-turn-helix transcriptional regulator, partial [Clostridia bacterium]
MNEINNTIGKRIANLRKDKNISQEDLGEALSVSRQSVSRWESDANIPEVDKLIELGKFFNVSLAYILNGEEFHKTDEESNSDSDFDVEEVKQILNAFVEESNKMKIVAEETRIQK